MSNLPVLIRHCTFPQKITEEIFEIKSVDEITSYVNNALRDPRLREAIKAANPGLLMMFETAQKLDSGIYKTLLKYLIRASYRPTPFGLFSSVGELSPGIHDDYLKEPEIRTKVLSGVNRFYDSFTDMEKIEENFDSLTFLLNSCSVLTGNQITYWKGIRVESKFFYEKTCLDVPRTIKDLLEFCKTKKTFKEICRYFKIRKTDQLEIREALIDLIRDQVIETDIVKSNIRPMESEGNWEENFKFASPPNLHARTESFRKAYWKYDKISFFRPNNISFQKIEKFRECLDGLYKQSFYWNAENSLWYSTLKTEFQNNFGHRRVPALQFILDYSSVQEKKEPRLAPFEMRKFYWQKFNQALLNDDEYAELNDSDISYLESIMDKVETRTPFPIKDYGIIAAFSNKPDGKYLGQFVYAQFGQGAARSYGRLEGILPSVSIDSRDDSGNIILADIDFESHDHISDLSRRIKTSKFVISLSHSSFNDDRVLIHADDLELFMEQGRFKLFSKHHQKEVILLITSPFILTTHTHPFFRFLGYVAQDGHKVYLEIPLEASYLNFQPGLVYKDVILFPKKWFLTKKDILNLFNDANLKQKLKIPHWVCIRDGDRILPMATNNSFMAGIMLEKASENDFIFLEEDWHLNHGAPIIQNGNKYSNEILFPWINSSALQGSRLIPKNHNWVHPDQAPVSIHIELPRTKSDVTLLEVLRKLEKLKKLNKISGFYYLFYPSPSFHLRLRIFGDSYQIHSLLFSTFQKLKNIGLINNYFLTPFEDESQTYGGKKGEFLYHRISVKLSSYAIDRLKLKMKYLCEVHSLYGNPLDVIYLVELHRSLKKRFGLNLPLPSNDIIQVKQLVSQFWKTYKHMFKHENALRREILHHVELIMMSLDNEITSYFKKWELGIVNIEPIHFFQRLMHLEVFRIKGGEYPYLEVSVPFIESKAYYGND